MSKDSMATNLERRKIKHSTFTIAYNGSTDGPAQPLRDYLLAQGSKKVIMIAHPLVPEGTNKHIITQYVERQGKDP
jgi:hypothetical protein